VTSNNSTASVYNSLPGDDVVRDATLQEVSQVAFSVSPLGAPGGISRPTKSTSAVISGDSAVSTGSAVQSGQLALRDSRGKFAVEEEIGLRRFSV
jgi:hypothetical protein